MPIFKKFRLRSEIAGGGGTARSYYVGIESAVPAVPGVEPPVVALCLAPFGMEEGTEAPLPSNELGVVVRGLGQERADVADG